MINMIQDAQRSLNERISELNEMAVSEYDTVIYDMMAQSSNETDEEKKQILEYGIKLFELQKKRLLELTK